MISDWPSKVDAALATLLSFVGFFLGFVRSYLVVNTKFAWVFFRFISAGRTCFFSRLFTRVALYKIHSSLSLASRRSCDFSWLRAM